VFRWKSRNDFFLDKSEILFRMEMATPCYFEMRRLLINRLKLKTEQRLEDRVERFDELYVSV